MDSGPYPKSVFPRIDLMCLWVTRQGGSMSLKTTFKLDIRGSTFSANHIGDIPGSSPLSIRAFENDHTKAASMFRLETATLMKITNKF